MSEGTGPDLLDEPPAEPLTLLREWLEAAAREGARAPFAASLATASADGAPSVRFVALEDVTDEGLVFATSTESPKGRQMRANPRVALALHWPETNRQVRVAGTVSALLAVESDRLFDHLPRDAQASLVTARQSEPLDSEAELHRAVRELASGAEPLTRPPEWQGVLVTPSRVEFWAASEDKVHRRLAYTRSATGWVTRRLQP